MGWIVVCLTKLGSGIPHNIGHVQIQEHLNSSTIYKLWVLISVLWSLCHWAIWMGGALEWWVERGTHSSTQKQWIAHKNLDGAKIHNSQRRNLSLNIWKYIVIIGMEGIRNKIPQRRDKVRSYEWWREGRGIFFCLGGTYNISGRLWDRMHQNSFKVNVFFRTGDQCQGPVHARQGCYYWATSSALRKVNVFDAVNLILQVLPKETMGQCVKVNSQGTITESCC